MHSRLPQELVSLVHHIELNKAGWWDRGIQQLVVFVIWREGNSPVDPSEISYRIRKEFNVQMDNTRVGQIIENLHRGNRLLKLPNGRIKLTEAEYLRVNKLIEESKEVDQQVQSKFVNLVKEICPSLDAQQVWLDFRDLFIARLVKSMGAYLFDLILNYTGDTEIDQASKRYLEEFISRYSEPRLRDVVARFLDPKNIAVRTYILQTINTYFFVQASGLTEKSLKKLSEIMSSKIIQFNIFVDTNFLFSILNLHDNPSNEAAKALVDLTKKLPQGVRVKFYVTPLTLEEAKRVLIAVRDSLQEIRPETNLLRAAQHVVSSGIEQKFFEACSQNSSLDAKSYFDPYINNLLTVARSKGVELYNVTLDSYKTKQEVIDDIEGQLRIQEHHNASRAKTYGALEHDMVLWHFVKDLRPAYMEFSLEAQFWIVTVDYRFIAFDRKKGHDFPICIHPTDLVHMLQFWVPRSDALDEALFTSLRLPLFVSGFNQEAEKVAITILKTISRFENVGDLPEDVIVKMLLNESLRARIQSMSDEKDQVELIREHLITEYSNLKRTLESEREKHNREKRTWEKWEQKGQEKIKELNREVENLHNAVSELQQKIKAYKFLLLWGVLIPFSLFLISFIIAYAITFFFHWEPKEYFMLAGMFFLLMLLFWLWMFDKKARKKSIEHPFVERIISYKRHIYGFILTMIVGILADFLKELLGGLIKKITIIMTTGKLG